jgi:hypothetical protein
MVVKDASKGLCVPAPRGSSTVVADSTEGQGMSLPSVVPRIGLTDADPVARPDDLPSDLSMSTTVLLAPDEHGALMRWCGQAASELGRSSVACQEVLQGLVARLVADPRLAADVLADFRERAGIAEIQRFAAW